MGPVVELPKHVRAPSAYEQHWVRYAVAGAIASYAAIFVYRCTAAKITTELFKVLNS